MDIESIRTEGEYALALQEIDRLWGSKPNTPEGDTLEALVAMVSAYEDEQEPFDL